MKAMQPASARTLTVTAALVVLVGLVVMSPAAAFLAFCLATILAAVPAFFGAGKMRLLAAALLLGAAVLAVGKYSAFRADQQRYRERVKIAGLSIPQFAKASDPRTPHSVSDRIGS